MKYTFINRPSVKLDIIEAVGYYKKINTALAHQFLFRIREAKIYIGKKSTSF